MTPELAYFLKINVAIALFYAFYRLFFHKDTFFHWRRTALLCFFGISLLYPLLNIQEWIKEQEPMVAMADLYGEHPLRETRAFNYIKEFAGVCFQSVVITLVFMAMNMIMAVFMEHFGKQISDGAKGIGALMAMGLKIAVFKLVQVGLVVSSANRAKKLLASA